MFINEKLIQHLVNYTVIKIIIKTLIYCVSIMFSNDLSINLKYILYFCLKNKILSVRIEIKYLKFKFDFGLALLNLNYFVSFCSNNRYGIYFTPNRDER